MGSPLARMQFYRQQYSDFIYEPPRPHAEVLTLMQNCDILALPAIVEGRALVQQEALASGLPLLPYIVEQTGEARDGLIRDWPPPDFGIDQHLSYMVQWYSFGLLGCVLWVGLNWRGREPRDD